MDKPSSPAPGKNHQIWDLNSGQCRRTVDSDSNPVSAIALSPDGHTIVSGCGKKTIKVWDLNSEVVKKFPNRDSSCTGAKRWQCFRKSPLSHCATAPHRVQRREGRGVVLLMAFCARALLWRRFYAGWASVTDRIRLWASAYHNATAFTLLSPRTKNCVSPRPRAMALTHSAVAARCL